MKRDNRRPPGGGSELHVAPTLTHPNEAGLSERLNRFRSRDDRKLRAQAAISTDAMIGGSFVSGTGASSK